MRLAARPPSGTKAEGRSGAGTGKRGSGKRAARLGRSRRWPGAGSEGGLTVAVGSGGGPDEETVREPGAPQSCRLGRVDVDGRRGRREAQLGTPGGLRERSFRQGRALEDGGYWI